MTQALGVVTVPDLLAEPRWDIGLDLEDTTLAEAFRASGYRTGIVGKWHLPPPERRRQTR